MQSYPKSFLYFLEENADLSASLVTKAIRAHRHVRRHEKRVKMHESGKKRKRSDTLLTGKLTPAQSRNAAKNELYLVEGDSAGGSAKQGETVNFRQFFHLEVKLSTQKKRNLKIS